MESTCLGDVYDQVSYSVECVNLKETLDYNRNFELLDRLNLGGFYEFFKALSNAVRLNYFATSRPTKLEFDSATRELCKSVKHILSSKRRRVAFAHCASSVSGSYRSSNASYASSLGNTSSIGSSTAPEYSVLDNTTSANLDFFVNDRYLVALSPFGAGNIRVTCMPTNVDFAPPKPHAEFEAVKNVGVRSFVVVTGSDSYVSTLCANDCFGFGFELFVGFADKSVCFFKLSTQLEDEAPLYSPGGAVCYNVTGFLFLDKRPTFSKFSPNRELVLVATRSSLYVLEKSGFELEYDRLCDFRSGSLICADFLNDFEVLVLESNCLLTVYKRLNLKFSVYIRYNLASLMTHFPSASGLGAAGAAALHPSSARSASGAGPSSGFSTARAFTNFALGCRRYPSTSLGRAGKMVKDFRGNVFLLVKNADLIKLTWNETLIPYSSLVSFQTPAGLQSNSADLLGENPGRLVGDFNVENNLVALTFAGSSHVHLYSLQSFKELHQLKPPKPDYLPKFVKSSSSNGCCFLLVMWSYKSNFYDFTPDAELPGHTSGVGGAGGVGYERDLRNADILRSYKIKSALTRCPNRDEFARAAFVGSAYGDFGSFKMGAGEPDFPGYSSDGEFKDAESAPVREPFPSGYKEWAARKVPLLSSLHPRVPSSYNPHWADIGRFDDAFSARRGLFGRTLNEPGLREETIYSIDEFLRNRRR